jgi:chloramphenicol O-acetyltransferase
MEDNAQNEITNLKTCMATITENVKTINSNIQEIKESIKSIKTEFIRKEVFEEYKTNTEKSFEEYKANTLADARDQKKFINKILITSIFTLIGFVVQLLAMIFNKWPLIN